MINALLQADEVRLLTHIFVHRIGQDLKEHRFKMSVRDARSIHVFHFGPFADPKLEVLGLITFREIMKRAHTTQFNLVGTAFMFNEECAPQFKSIGVTASQNSAVVIHCINHMFANEGPQGSRQPVKVDSESVMVGIQETHLEVCSGYRELMGLDLLEHKLPIGVSLDEVVLQAAGPDLVSAMSTIERC